MKFGVVTFPGSNCDQDLVHALGTIMGQSVTELWHKDRDLKGCDFIFLPGGFSYGDYLRSGAIAKFSPIMNSIIEFAKKGGYVMGICNGFQILTESHLLPGTLLHNDHRKFACKNVFLRTETTNSAISSGLKKGQVLKIPIAHGEGKYYAPEKELKQLQDKDQVLFRYCLENGETGSGGNPNGSLDHIAGICNAQRNVFGMMPHPERAMDPQLGNEDGKYILESVLHVTALA